jgi:glyoxylase-like metal-dependent hydrolase (beta-lactamase superfamily II)
LIDGEHKILVDTGFECEWLTDEKNIEKNARNLKRALRDNGVAPDEIDMVFITHWHKDHFGNAGLFQKAQFLVSTPLSERFGQTDLVGINDGAEIAAGIKVAFTPGHTVDHASLIVDTRYNGMKTRIAVAGDAVIAHSYFQSGKIWKYNPDFFDEAAARASTHLIADSSDVIIPGHGVPFLNSGLRTE